MAENGAPEAAAGDPAADAPAGNAGTGGAADRMRAGAEQMRDAFNERVVEPARRAGEAMRASGHKMAEGGSALGMRMIDQAEANAHEAFAAMRRAAQASDVSEVMRIQGDYLRDQAARGVAQAREIGEMIAQFGRDAVGSMRGGNGGGGS